LRFQIEKVLLENRQIALSEPAIDSGNLFTMLVGRNAVGKTRTISKIANQFVFARDGDEVILAEDSLPEPARVIAVSTSSFDRFPEPARIKAKRSMLRSQYYYFGLSNFRAGPYRLLSRAFAALFEDSGNYHRWRTLENILDYVGFLPYFQIELRRTGITYKGASINELLDEYKTLTGYPAGEMHNIDLEREVLPALEYLRAREKSKRGLSFDVDAMHRPLNNSDFEEFSRYAMPLLKSEMIKVGRLTLFDKRSKDKVLFHHSSSGQQCLLLMFFGLCGAISNNSLICIDEPEISLHPKWQSEFIGILQKAFSYFSGCHFIIATHSPQITSGLVADNGFISDLEASNLIRAEAYAHKSADVQLSEIFHEPGYKNEYLIRVLLVLLSKLTKEGVLSDEERKRFRHVQQMEGRLDAGDPVIHLLNQIKMLLS